MNGHWQIVKCEPFLTRLKSARERAKRIDQFISGAEKALAVDPSFGKKTGINHLFALPMAQVDDNPEVVLYYLITKEEVLFVDLRVGNVNIPQRIFL